MEDDYILSLLRALTHVDELAGYLDVMGLGPSGDRLRRERDGLAERIGEDVPVVLSQGVTEEQRKEYRRVYGPFPSLDGSATETERAAWMRDRRLILVGMAAQFVDFLSGLKAAVAQLPEGEHVAARDHDVGAANERERDDEGWTDLEGLTKRYRLDRRQRAVVKGRLCRWRRAHAIGSDYVEKDGRAPRESQFLYRVSAIAHLLPARKASRA